METPVIFYRITHHQRPEDRTHSVQTVDKALLTLSMSRQRLLANTSHFSLTFILNNKNSVALVR
jgi:hypothetical protein